MPRAGGDLGAACSLGVPFVDSWLDIRIAIRISNPLPTVFGVLGPAAAGHVFVQGCFEDALDGGVVRVHEGVQAPTEVRADLRVELLPGLPAGRRRRRERGLSFDRCHGRCHRDRGWCLCGGWVEAACRRRA